MNFLTFLSKAAFVTSKVVSIVKSVNEIIADSRQVVSEMEEGMSDLKADIYNTMQENDQICMDAKKELADSMPTGDHVTNEELEKQIDLGKKLLAKRAKASTDNAILHVFLGLVSLVDIAIAAGDTYTHLAVVTTKTDYAKNIFTIAARLVF